MKKALYILMLLSTAACSKIPQTVLINEVAWMGTTASPEHQWIELFNTTGTAIDLTGWTLRNTDTTFTITLSTTIPPYGYVLLERGTDDAIPEVPADQIFSGALKTSADGLVLLNPQNKAIDAVTSWFAGNNTNKATMERTQFTSPGFQAASWITSTYAYSQGLGTPKQVNSYFAEENVSDTNCNYPDQLEITSINIGQGDATLIASKTKLLLADAGETYWNSHRDANKIAAEIATRYGDNCKTLDYVVISHLHTDHIGYIQPEEDGQGNLLNSAGGAYQEGDNLLNPNFMSGYAYLVGNLGFVVKQTLLRDYKAHNPNKTPANGGSKAYRNWRALFESAQGRQLFNPITAELGSHQINMGTINGSPIETDIVLVDTATPSNLNGCDPATYFGGAQYLARGDRSEDLVTPSENDLSVGFMLNYGAFNLYVAGDQSGENEESPFGYRYHDTETCLAQDVAFAAKYSNRVDVLRGNHHGSSHSSNPLFINALSPTVTIFSVGDHNNFNHVDKTVLSNALNTSTHLNAGAVWLTEIGANVASQSDLCDSLNPLLCAQVADNEFPAALESDEAGDAGVHLSVTHGGYQYSVSNGNTTEPNIFASK